MRATAAYDVLSDETKRARYDRGDGDDSDIYQGFDFGRASYLFNRDFSQAMMQRWRPGLTVSGTLVWDGRFVSITIHPDGTTEEHDQGRAFSVIRLFCTTTTLPGGGRTHSILFSTALGEALAALLVPDALARTPLFGPLATTVVTWVPTVLVGCLALRLFGPRRHVPGAIPDSLAEAFRHVPPSVQLHPM